MNFEFHEEQAMKPNQSTTTTTTRPTGFYRCKRCNKVIKTTPPTELVIILLTHIRQENNNEAKPKTLDTSVIQKQFAQIENQR